MKRIILILLLSVAVELTNAQTTLWFSQTSATVTPEFNGGWEDVDQGARFVLNHTKGTSSITAGTQISWTAGVGDALDRQYISPPMEAGIVFSTTSSWKGQVMTREYNNGDNVDRVISQIKIVSEDGSTVRRNLTGAVSFGTQGEFINNLSHRNCTIANTDNLNVSGSDYTTVDGDRLVFEFGYLENAGATPVASAKWGENATDLPENDTQTTDGAGWVQVSVNITWKAAAATHDKFFRIFKP